MKKLANLLYLPLYYALAANFRIKGYNVPWVAGFSDVFNKQGCGLEVQMYSRPLDIDENGEMNLQVIKEQETIRDIADKFVEPFGLESFCKKGKVPGDAMVTYIRLQKVKKS